MSGKEIPMTEKERAEWAIRILQRKTTVPDKEFSFEEINEAIDYAIWQLGKNIPQKPIREMWNPNLCPTCRADLGGRCNDGYYDNPWFDRCPECGQKLDYEEG